MEPSVHPCPNCGATLLVTDTLEECVMMTPHDNELSTRAERLAAEQLNSLAHTADHLQVWEGPQGAKHALRPNFWNRVQAALTAYHELTRSLATDNDYVSFPRFGKVLRVPQPMMDEFLQFVDRSQGRDHVTNRVIGSRAHEMNRTSVLLNSDHPRFREMDWSIYRGG